MANIGDIITLGSYPQNNSYYSKGEAIEWIVLDKNNECLLCISKYLLDCKPYNGLYDGVDCVNFDGYIEENEDYVTAKNCSVRPALWVKL